MRHPAGEGHAGCRRSLLLRAVVCSRAFPSLVLPLKESPSPSKAEFFEQLRGRSDQPAMKLVYPPQMKGVKQA
jgi:hypothetical protein